MYVGRPLCIVKSKCQEPQRSSLLALQKTLVSFADADVFCILCDYTAVRIQKTSASAKLTRAFCRASRGHTEHDLHVQHQLRCCKDCSIVGALVHHVTHHCKACKHAQPTYLNVAFRAGRVKNSVWGRLLKTPAWLPCWMPF